MITKRWQTWDPLLKNWLPTLWYVSLICNIFYIILESQSWTKGSFWEHVFILNSDKLGKLGVCWIDKVPSLVWDYRKSNKLGKLFLKLLKQSTKSMMKWDLIKDSVISYILVWSLVLLLNSFIIFSRIWDSHYRKLASIFFHLSSKELLGTWSYMDDIFLSLS